MIVGISAGQGQGKSTLINALCELDGFERLELQTSREILKEWGYTLDEVNRYLPLKQRFQEECLRRHTKALNQGHGSPFDSDNETPYETILLVERTFSDIYAYTVLGMGAFNEYSEWLHNYGLQCAQAQNAYFNEVVFMTGRTYTPEDDGVRSINQDFSDVANHLIKKYTLQFSEASVIDTAGLDERVANMRNIADRLRAEEAA